MSLDLTDGFLAQAQVTESVMGRILASTFGQRVGVLRTSLPQGVTLEIWFDTPRLTLVRNVDPAAALVEVELRTTARLSDRFDEGRVTVTARAKVMERTAGERVAPALDFRASAASDFMVQSSNNPLYDAVVLSAVTEALRANSPLTVGPLGSGIGRMQFGTYSDLPGSSGPVMALLLDAGFGDRPVPSRITNRTSSSTGVIFLVPDDAVNQGIQKGLEAAGLATLPAQLNPNVTVSTLSVQLKHNHMVIEGSGTASTDIVGIPVGTGFTFKAFVQLLVQNGRVKVHVIRTEQDLDNPIIDFADFITAGALTRLLEEMGPKAVQSLNLGGSVQGLAFFSSSVPDESLFPRSEVQAVLSHFANGLGIPYEVITRSPPHVEPPYIRGHLQSREFHVKGCQFGDLIKNRNLRRFPRTEAAIQAGYDGCNTCQPEFNVAVFGDLGVTVTQPTSAGTDAVTITATYAGNIVRFGVPLAPPVEKKVSDRPVVQDGVRTHRASFLHIVPAPWSVTISSGAWSVTDTVVVERMFPTPDGQMHGARTDVQAVVGQPGIERVV